MFVLNSEADSCFQQYTAMKYEHIVTENLQRLNSFLDDE